MIKRWENTSYEERLGQLDCSARKRRAQGKLINMSKFMKGGWKKEGGRLYSEVSSARTYFLRYHWKRFISYYIFIFSYWGRLEGHTSRLADFYNLLTFATRSCWYEYLQPSYAGILIHLKIFALSSLWSGCVQNCCLWIECPSNKTFSALGFVLFATNT